MPNHRNVQAARTIISKCLALAPESEIAIVADDTTWGIARLLADAAVDLGYCPLE